MNSTQLNSTQLNREAAIDWIELITTLKYLNERGSSGFAHIARLQHQDGYAESCEEISETLIRNFFPELPKVQSTQIEAAQSFGEPIEHAPLTVEEVKEAIFRASPFKAPGSDGIPAIVWRELWPVVGKYIYQLFNQSLLQGRLPSRWRIARIIPLSVKNGRIGKHRSVRIRPKWR